MATRAYELAAVAGSGLAAAQAELVVAAVTSRRRQVGDRWSAYRPVRV